jgi:glucose-1-phosphate thymidylyltransferase
MNAVVLAAGYATRLRPLTDDVAKSLLPVGGRPMLDWILDKLEEVDVLDAVHIVTNSRYAHDFDRWAAGAERRLPIVVHDDGTRSNDDRLGAIGDIQLTIDRAGLGFDDLLVIAGDNLFDFSLTELVDWWRGKGVASALALYDCGDLELATHYSVVAVDDDGRIRSFVEKPADPSTTLVGTATYVYHRDHVPLVAQYLAEGHTPDAPGNLVAWLHRREPVYGFTFDGSWMDIGNHEQLLAADNLLRRRRGLPEVERYSAQI